MGANVAPTGLVFLVVRAPRAHALGYTMSPHTGLDRHAPSGARERASSPGPPAKLASYPLRGQSSYVRMLSHRAAASEPKVMMGAQAASSGTMTLLLPRYPIRKFTP